MKLKRERFSLLRPRLRVILPVLGLLFILLINPCGSQGSETAGSISSSVEPRIGIIKPQPGASFSAESIDVQVSIEGLTVDPYAIGKAAVPGSGHWHIYLDGAFINASAVGTVTLDPLPLGPHHLRVSLANNDHSPLSPPVEDSLVIDVMGEAVEEDELAVSYTY